MRRLFLTLVTVLTLIISSSASRARATQSPGKEHEELKTLVGTWDAVLKPAEGDEVKGVAEFRMTCEGMWLESDFKADFGGQKFHGQGLDSYDSEKKHYTSIWVDSMNGSPMVLTGKKEDKVTTMTGEGPGPAGTSKVKTVSTYESADKMSFEMFMISGDNEVKLMTVNYTRRKK